MKSRRAVRVLAIAVPVVLLIGGAVGVTKGRFGAYLDYARGGNSYLGNAVLTERIVVRDGALLSRLKTDPDYEDYRRRHPDLAAPMTERITAPHSKLELAGYTNLINEFRDIAARDEGRRTDVTAGAVITLVFSYSKHNRVSGRKIDSGILGKDRSRPEDYLFYLANAETACGTMSESAVALLRAAGFRARLVLLAHNPRRIQADHVLAEYYSESSGKWVMVDPTIGYQGRESVLTVLGDAELSAELNRRHGAPHYRKQTTAVIDRRGPSRKIFYFTPSEDGRNITQAVLDQE